MPQALTPQQRKGLAAAPDQQAYLAQHPGVAKHQQKVAAQGAPGQGAGGQKAGGQAAPPKQPQQPAAGAPAQGVAGKGQAKQPKAQALTGQQTKGLAAAQAAGTEADYLKAHPGVAKHQQKIGAPAPGAPAQGAGGKGGAAANAATPPPGNPAAGAGGDKQGAQPPPGTNAANPAAAPATTDDIINQQYGAGAADKFQQNWYGDNPLTTALNVAQRQTGEALGGVRNRYAQSGFGTSGREALAEGQAVADVATNLGDKLATLGTQVRGSDLDRLAGMFATSGQQDLASQELGLKANEMLANLGTGVTGIGANEQQIPGADFITTLLTNMSQQPTYSQGRQRQPRK